MHFNSNRVRSTKMNTPFRVSSDGHDLRYDDARFKTSLSMELTEEQCDALVKKAQGSLGSNGFEIYPFKVRKTETLYK